MTSSTHLHLASETSGRLGLPSGRSERPHGRVGAEIVCDDTLVQYAAYWLLLLLRGRKEWYHSIPIILVGMALHLLFFRSVFAFLARPFCLGCFVRWVGLGRMVFFGVSANLWGCGLVSRVFRVGGYVAREVCFGDALVGWEDWCAGMRLWAF